MATSLLEKAKKLVALAADARGNENERANAAIKACELIAKEKLLESGAGQKTFFSNSSSQPPSHESYSNYPSGNPFAGFEDFLHEMRRQDEEHARRRREAAQAKEAYEQARREKDDPKVCAQNNYRKGYDAIDWKKASVAASGAVLDAIASMLGVCRLEGETDESLRQRTREGQGWAKP